MARPKKTTTKTVSKTTLKPTASTVTKTPKKVKLVSPAALPNRGSQVILHRIGFLASRAKSQRRIIIPIVILAILIGLVLLAQKYLVIAWVDNKPITLFQYYQSMDSQYGSQTKDELIREQLILDEASKRKVAVSTQEIDAQIKKYQDQSQGIDNFNQALAAQGLTLESLKKQVKLQLLIQKMFGSSATVSDDEVTKYISDHKDQLPADITDTVKQSVRDQLSQQKLVDAFQAWLATAEKSSQVKK